MTTRRAILSFAALLFTAGAAFAQAATDQKPFEPQVGQAGKDVVWVPTPQALVDKMLDMAKVTKTDFVDRPRLRRRPHRDHRGEARRDARWASSTTPTWWNCRRRTPRRPASTARATFVKADLFETDFSKADVITMFLLPSINMKLRPKILDLEPGTRIVVEHLHDGRLAGR